MQREREIKKKGRDNIGKETDKRTIIRQIERETCESFLRFPSFQPREKELNYIELSAAETKFLTFLKNENKN